MATSTATSESPLEKMLNSIEQHQQSNSSTSVDRVSPSYTSIIGERSRLFNSGCRRGRGSSSSSGSRRNIRGGSQKRKDTSKRTWTVSFMCLANKHSCKVPNSTEKMLLQNGGLGFKKTKLDMSAK